MHLVLFDLSALFCVAIHPVRFIYATGNLHLSQEVTTGVEEVTCTDGGVELAEAP